MWRDRYTAQVGEGTRPSAPQTSDPLTKLTALNPRERQRPPKVVFVSPPPNPQGHERGRRLGLPSYLRAVLQPLSPWVRSFSCCPLRQSPAIQQPSSMPSLRPRQPCALQGWWWSILRITGRRSATFVILVLIQLGGFGFMTSSILLFMLLGSGFDCASASSCVRRSTYPVWAELQYHTQYRHLDDCRSGSRHLGALALLRAESRALAGVLDGIVSRHIGI